MRKEFPGQLVRRAERVPAQVSFSLTLQRREVRAETYAELELRVHMMLYITGALLGVEGWSEGDFTEQESPR